VRRDNESALPGNMNPTAATGGDGSATRFASVSALISLYLIITMDDCLEHGSTELIGFEGTTRIGQKRERRTRSQFIHVRWHSAVI